MPADPMLAAMLMNQPRRKSPLGSLAEGFQAGYGQPSDMVGGGNMWEEISRFLAGQSRRKDKMSPQDDPMKASESGLSDSIGMGGGWGSYM